MMAEKIERTYKTTFTEEINMDKYTELLKDIARVSADTDREKFLLKCELDAVKAALRDAEGEIKRKDQKIAAAEDQLETAVAKQAIQMMQEDGASA